MSILHNGIINTREEVLTPEEISELLKKRNTILSSMNSEGSKEGNYEASLSGINITLTTAFFEPVVRKNHMVNNKVINPNVGSKIVVSYWDYGTGEYEKPSEYDVVEKAQTSANTSRIKYGSPLVKAVMGKKVGDVVYIKTPGDRPDEFVTNKVRIEGFVPAARYIREYKPELRQCRAADEQKLYMQKAGPSRIPAVTELYNAFVSEDAENYEEGLRQLLDNFEYDGKMYDDFFVLSPSQWLLAYNEYCHLLELCPTDKNGKKILKKNGNRIVHLRKLLNKPIAEPRTDGKVGTGSIVTLELIGPCTDPNADLNERYAMVITREWIPQAWSSEPSKYYVEYIDELGFAIEGKEAGDSFSYYVRDRNDIESRYIGRILSVDNKTSFLDNYLSKVDTEGVGLNRQNVKIR